MRSSKSDGASAGSGSGQASGGKLTLAYNADGPHKAWVEAVCNSVTNTLGITMEPLPVAQFSELRKQVTDRTLVGAFRTGWQADYPSMNNFLGAVYQTGAGSNDSDYSSQEFDDFLAQAAAASDDTAALGFYTQAQFLSALVTLFFLQSSITVKQSTGSCYPGTLTAAASASPSLIRRLF